MQRIGADRAELANAYAAQEQKVDTLPEDAVHKMIDARNEWKNAYNMSAKNAAWQGMLFAINSLFKQ